MKATLYTTVGCHLCNEALHLLEALKAGGMNLEIHEQEIAESEKLLRRYGTRIPVVTTPAKQADIGWPFTAEQLREFLTTDG